MATATQAPKQSGTEIATAPREPTNSRIGVIVKTLEAHKPKIEAALGKRLSADRVIGIARTIAFRTPDLQKCEASSILAAIIRASSLQLDLEPSAMEAYLIPRWNSQAGIMECNFQIGYQGIRKMVYRTGKVAAFETRLVYANENFRVRYSPMLKLIHDPIFDESERGELVGGYGYGRLRNSDPFITYMPKAEILRLKARGKGKQPAWGTDFEQMCHKTICFRLGKLFPKSQEMIDVLRDEHELDGIDMDAGRADETPRRRGSIGLRDRLEALPSEPPPEHTAPPDESNPDDEFEGTYDLPQGRASEDG